MSSSVSEDQDQRKTMGMEELPTMTIESLRARLLSERSVSRTAKHRADELAKRVAELEKQLRIVSLQRKRAEKATGDVLAILENHGISDASEGFDSGPEHEVCCESEVGDDKLRGKQTSDCVQKQMNDLEAYSSSEVESCPSTGRSLSWNSGKGTSHSLERKNYVDTGRRRFTSFSSTCSSPKRGGKSCRKIRRKESRLVEDLKNDVFEHASHDDGAAKLFSDPSNCSGGGLKCPREEDSEYHEDVEPQEGTVAGLSGKRDDGHISGGEERELEYSMLQHQGQHLRHYEAEENAQRQLEENIRENNSCTPDSCDPGNHSDITEERDEMKPFKQQCPIGMMDSQNLEKKLETVEVSFKEKPRHHSALPHSDDAMGHLHHQRYSSSAFKESQASDFAFPVSNGNCIQKCSGKHAFVPACSHYCPLDNSTKRSTSFSSSSEEFNLHKEDTPGSGHELAVVHPESSSNIGSVLEALRKVKSSLRQKLNGLPEGDSSRQVVESFIPPRTGDRLEIPVGCQGLFRLPTDFQFQSNNKANYLGLGSRLSLENCSFGTSADTMLPQACIESRSRVFGTAGDRPYMESRSSAFQTANDHILPNPYLNSRSSPFATMPPSPLPEVRSRVPTGVPPQRPLSVPTLDAGLPTSTRFIYHDPLSSAGLPLSSGYSYPSFPDMKLPLISDEAFSRTLLINEAGMPPMMHFHDDHTRPNMYR